MSMTILGLMIATGLISYKGFNDYTFFNQYKFNISEVKNKKDYLRLISSGFLHADFQHLIFNLLSLYFFANVVENTMGIIGFLIIYFGSIIFGNLFSLFLYKDQPWYSSIGASGGVSGVIFTAIALSPNEISVNFLPGWIFGTLYFAYSIYMMLHAKNKDNIGHSAHLGGAMIGMIAVLITSPQIIVENALYIGIMSAPLLYMFYMIYQNKK